MLVSLRSGHIFIFYFIYEKHCCIIQYTYSRVIILDTTLWKFVMKLFFGLYAQYSKWSSYECKVTSSPIPKGGTTVVHYIIILVTLYIVVNNLVIDCNTCIILM